LVNFLEVETEEIYKGNFIQPLLKLGIYPFQLQRGISLYDLALFIILDIRLGKEVCWFCCQSVFGLVEIVYTSIGLWGLCYNQYEIQTRNVKEYFHRAR